MSHKTSHELARELLAGPDLPVWHFDPSRAGLDDESDTSLSVPRIETQSHADGLSAEEIEDYEEDGAYMGKFLTIVGDTDEAGEARGTGFDLVRHLLRQRGFSERTFGPGARTAGVCDHIREELREIEAAPGDLSEWIDVALLAFDGAWRAGYDPEQIVAALEAKQAKNESRQWPDWRTADQGKAIKHVVDPNSVQAAAAAPDVRAGCTIPSLCVRI